MKLKLQPFILSIKKTATLVCVQKIFQKLFIFNTYFAHVLKNSLFKLCK